MHQNEMSLWRLFILISCRNEQDVYRLRLLLISSRASQGRLYGCLSLELGGAIQGKAMGARPADWFSGEWVYM